MGASVVLYRGIEKIAGNLEDSFDEKKDKIGDLFVKAGFMVPEDLMEDLFQFYVESSLPEDQNIESLRDLAYHLVDVVDLFSMDYDSVKDPIKLDEWIAIRNLFSSYADGIEDDLLTYVMQIAVEKGAFR